jgi:hypothetical protein
MDKLLDIPYRSIVLDNHPNARVIDIPSSIGAVQGPEAGFPVSLFRNGPAQDIGGKTHRIDRALMVA